MKVAKVERSTILHSLLLLVATAGCVLSQATPAQSPTMIWSIDLFSEHDFQQRSGVFEGLLTPPSLNFLNDDQILLSYFDGERIGFNPSLTPHNFHVVEISAHTGSFGRKLDFQTFDDHSRALPVADGGFLVLGGNELRRFSSEFVPGPSYPTPTASPNGRPDVWIMDVSPSGRAVVLYYHRVPEPQGSWFWLRTSDLTPTREMKASLTSVIRGSDTSAILYSGSDAELLHDGKTSVLCNMCDAHFISDDLLFIDRQRMYTITTTNGEGRGSGKLNIQANDFTRAASVPRIAFVTGHYSGHCFLLCTNFDRLTGEVIVMDWSTNKRVASISINEPAGNPSAGLSQMALALAPDGKELAVLLHHTLTCYHLP